jgi:hypothetical protein
VRRQLLLLVILGLVFNSSHAAEPEGLRQAMANYDNAREERDHKLYGSVARKIDPSSYQFKYALVDLNGDGIQDAVVYLTSNDWCGTGGCAMRILKGTKSGFTYVSGTLRVFLPIKVLTSESHGWKSLVVTLRSGKLGVLKFDGMRYPLSPPDDHPAPSSVLRGAMTLIPR